MKIELVANRGNVIAEEIDGGDGYFLEKYNGSVVYLNDAESIEWYVNSSLEKFNGSVIAFNWYSDAVLNFDTEEEQLEIVKELKRKLFDIEVYHNTSCSYWEVISDQAECGHI